MKMGRKKLIFGAEDSFIAYSLPGNSSYYLLHSKDCDHTKNTTSSPPPPFCISSFLKEKDIYSFAHCTENTAFEFFPEKKTKLLSTDKHKYITDTKKIIAEISAGAYQKLVYSRVKHVDRSEQGVAELFLRLAAEHRSAFVFCYHIPERGCWMGATPELLIKKEAGQYRTMALAGTQLDLGLPLAKVVWGEKEKAEQEFIVNFVKQELTKRSTHFSISENRTVKAGEVLHICTDFLIDSEDYNITDVAEYLHPGPAISGTPKEIAIERIGQLEDHDRDDYCGYLGPLGEESALYINLRSMQIFEDAYILYLGGGITYDSDPEEEWKETEDKSKTLMHLIEKSYTS